MQRRLRILVFDIEVVETSPGVYTITGKGLYGDGLKQLAYKALSLIPSPKATLSAEPKSQFCEGYCDTCSQWQPSERSAWPCPNADHSIKKSIWRSK